MLSKKYYKLIAEAISDARDSPFIKKEKDVIPTKGFIERLEYIFAQDNPNFDEQKFRAAVFRRKKLKEVV
jgi:hypothetical protein